jgi:hypothetical protein
VTGSDDRRASLRTLATEALGVPVTSVDFGKVACDRADHDALCAAIRAELNLFRADHVPEVLINYPGAALESKTAPAGREPVKPPGME